MRGSSNCWARCSSLVTPWVSSYLQLSTRLCPSFALTLLPPSLPPSLDVQRDFRDTPRQAFAQSSSRSPPRDGRPCVDHTQSQKPARKEGSAERSTVVKEYELGPTLLYRNDRYVLRYHLISSLFTSMSPCLFHSLFLAHDALIVVTFLSDESVSLSLFDLRVRGKELVYICI